jgi:hypothetical protein
MKNELFYKKSSLEHKSIRAQLHKSKRRKGSEVEGQGLRKKIQHFYRRPNR